MTFIPQAMYQSIASALPILCVDVILQNGKGEYLLVKRVNEPKRGRWWPVGGRVLKGETLPVAATRKVREETGLSTGPLKPVGYFEYCGLRGPFGISTGYHTVSIVFAGSVGDGRDIVPDNQSSDWKFAKGLPADFRLEPFPGSGSLTSSTEKGESHLGREVT
jgi:colanic acid biosynthesis protein WcaH